MSEIRPAPTGNQDGYLCVLANKLWHTVFGRLDCEEIVPKDVAVDVAIVASSRLLDWWQAHKALHHSSKQDTPNEGHLRELLRRAHRVAELLYQVQGDVGEDIDGFHNALEPFKGIRLREDD